jgi:hypothetical protein
MLRACSDWAHLWSPAILRAPPRVSYRPIVAFCEDKPATELESTSIVISAMRKSPRLIVVLVVLVGALFFEQSPRAEQPTAPADPVDQTLCEIIGRSAIANRLPTGFFSRLIWRESALRADAASPAGAQGVAQFMPGTAAERGLANPFDPETAIPEAARYLSELSTRFGNLGLAAAAYNAGPNRVASWLAGRSEMPLETRAYVLAITARPIEDWVKPPPEPGSAGGPSDEPSCLSVIAALRSATPAQTVAETPFAPWGVQLAGSFSKAAALAAFDRARDKYRAIIGDAEPFILSSRLRSRGASAFFRVRLPAATRGEADRLCGKLQAAGGACVVLRS